MSLSTAASPSRRRPVKKRSVWPWVLLSAAVLFVAGFIALKIAIDSYLHSESFRRFIGQKAGEALHAKVEVKPFQFTGSTVFSDGLESQGTAAAAFSKLGVEQVRVELSARRFFEHVWQVDRVDIQRVALHLDGPRITDDQPLSISPEPTSSHTASGTSSWLPNRVEIGTVTVQSADLHWPDGGISDATVQVKQQEGAWSIEAHGGTIKQTALPTLDVDSVKLIYRAPTLFVQDAELHEPGGGTINASGEAQPDDHVDVLAKLNRISISPLLEPDWRAKLSGNLNGEVRIKSPLPAKDAASVSGSINLTDGHLVALPVLDNIANLTQTERFRRLALTNASGDFDRTGSRLTVKNFVMESKGLIRIEGAFTIVNDMIDGNFQVGVSPSTLENIVGSREKVFTAARNGYLWAPMHLSGPVSKPTEDLSPRLEAAAIGAVVDTAKGAVQSILDAGKSPEVQKSVNDASQQLQKAAGSGLKLLFGN